MKYRKKSPIVDARQWFQHGDHERVEEVPRGEDISESRRGKVGWLPTPLPGGGHLIFPGDWIIIDKKGTISSCNPVSFARLYEVVDEMRILPTPAQFGRSA